MHGYVGSARWGVLAVALLVLVGCAAPASPRAAPTAPAAAKSAPNPASAAPAAAAPAPASPAAEPAARPAYDEAAVANFYRGKTVKIMVGHAPGGGYDTYSRLIGRHLGKHIPGNPTVIVENMPGAGSMIALNHTYSVAPKDGTVIVGPDGGLALQQLFGNPSAEFDMSKVHFLGSPSGFEYVMVVTRRSGITKFDELLGPNSKSVVLGGVPNTKIDHSAILLRDALGANVRLVSGYTGTAPVRLAMESGEVDGVITSWESLRISNMKDMENGDWTILLQINDKPIPELPQQNVPLIDQVARTDEQRQLFMYGIILPNQFSRPYLVAPGVPADRVAALQAAFARTLADPELLAEAERAQIELNPITAEDLRRQIVDFLDMPPAIRDRLKPILMPGS